eukprot:9270401-Alexandrium_andersonii.AAC.1
MEVYARTRAGGKPPLRRAQATICGARRSKHFHKSKTAPAKGTERTAHCSTASAVRIAASGAPRPHAPAWSSGQCHDATHSSRQARRVCAQLLYKVLRT